MKSSGDLNDGCRRDGEVAGEVVVEVVGEVFEGVGEVSGDVVVRKWLV